MRRKSACGLAASRTASSYRCCNRRRKSGEISSDGGGSEDMRLFWSEWQSVKSISSARGRAIRG